MHNRCDLTNPRRTCAEHCGKEMKKPVEVVVVVVIVYPEGSNEMFYSMQVIESELL